MKINGSLNYTIQVLKAEEVTDLDLSTDMKQFRVYRDYDR